MPSKTIIPVTHQARRRGEPPPLQARPRGFRFTDAFLQKLKMPDGKREVIQFEAGTGLGVRVSANGIFFIVQLPLPDGKRYRGTIGAYGKLTIDEARRAVQALAGDIAAASTRNRSKPRRKRQRKRKPRRLKSKNSPPACWSNDGGATGSPPKGQLTPCAPIAASNGCSEGCSIRRPRL